ncbi:hypothetical protein TBK1r_70160 [Stieleria magnilauensis]|uniref:Uncharacterized protein n=1 Tax=Stieleria magnilauensis TaxID=2527963 RepID=A0ABX5Y7C6_9BACT|nr:hypothetical protein TBK1r_70160 [Planctomycetes bacterium TBK1r]
MCATATENRLIATSVIYLEVESLICQSVLISKPMESGYSDHGA